MYSLHDLSPKQTRANLWLLHNLSSSIKQTLLIHPVTWSKRGQGYWSSCPTLTMRSTWWSRPSPFTSPCCAASSRCPRGRVQTGARCGMPYGTAGHTPWWAPSQSMLMDHWKCINYLCVFHSDFFGNIWLYLHRSVGTFIFLLSPLVSHCSSKCKYIVYYHCII